MGKISENLLKAIAVTAELTGTELSVDAARTMADDLSQYPEEAVSKALTKCRLELKTRMSLADIISRIDDGRPGAEEAWAMIPKDEQGSVVWTDEMAQAYGVAYQLINEGHTIQARMAFIEVYRDRCQKAREIKLPVKWSPSLGFDVEGREQVLIDAVENGRLTSDHAKRLLPYRDSDRSNVVGELQQLSGKFDKQVFELSKLINKK